MTLDLLERLRDAEVPEVPADIDEGIHQRLNTSLAISHLVDFVANALPHAFVEFAKPFGHLVQFTAGAPSAGKNRKNPDRQ